MRRWWNRAVPDPSPDKPPPPAAPPRPGAHQDELNALREAVNEIRGSKDRAAELLREWSNLRARAEAAEAKVEGLRSLREAVQPILAAYRSEQAHITEEQVTAAWTAFDNAGRLLRED